MYKLLNKKDLLYYLFAIISFGLGVFVSGCTTQEKASDFFARKPIELESKLVLRDISRVRENPHIYNPLPEMYRQPPKRLESEEGVKLFYYTKHHPSNEIAEQLKKLGFAVSQNLTTNQVIVHTANTEECDRVEQYLAKIDVPPIQVHIDCIILERYGDITKDWETTLLIENLFGEKITLGEDKYPNPALPGASLREKQRSTFGLDFGYWRKEGISGHQLRIVIDALESRGYLKILLNPTIETVNGKPATVQIRDRAPIEKVVTERNQIYKLTDYQWVADSLTVTPYVYSDGQIGLKTSITIGSKSKPEGVVQSSIITQRSIEIEENRIQPGRSLIIGGMRKSENLSVVRGVPFFKDIPLFGALFSSKDFEERATEIIYILTPSISGGGVDYSEMADTIREKHRNPEPDTALEAFIRDPLAGDAYLQYIEERAEKAKADTVRLERERMRAEFQANEERLRAEAAKKESEALQAQIDKTQAQYEAFLAQIEAAKTQAEAQAQQAKLLETQTTATEQELQAATEKYQQAQQAAQEAQAKYLAAQQKAQQAAERAVSAQEKAQQAKTAYEELLRQIQQFNALYPLPEKTEQIEPQKDKTAPEEPAEKPTEPAPTQNATNQENPEHKESAETQTQPANTP